jgi:hypothetical protein
MFRLHWLFLALAFLMASVAPAAADATSFNPLNVNVQAKQVGGGMPVGSVIPWPVSSDPADADKWLDCNGQTITAAAYPELFALVGANVPDYRGLFLRGYGSRTHSQLNGSAVGVTATTHASGALGAVQGDATREIGGPTHYGQAILGADHISTWRSVAFYNRGPQGHDYYNGWTEGHLQLDLSRGTPTSNEIRPVNTAVRYLIRALP